ncbi:HAD-IIB family hydrolase [Candidatus Saccharibacteria bacterium]|nr:HAD-IIB family hydrolase [Candidatus Saccharibacteria bacterium]
MTKKVIAFDLDDTLAVTKSPISDQMGQILVRLLEHYDVCIISGGKFEQFEKQVVDRLEAPVHILNRLHLMPTCGTRYYRYDELDKKWRLQYAEDLTVAEKKRIEDVTEKVAREAGLWPTKPYGDVIEDRGSQISISFLGQLAPAEKKYEWAAKHSEDRLRVRDQIAEQISEFEVRAGGSTTIDITRLGIDKAYGMKKLCEAIDISKDEVLFVGDKLDEGGNDYPVKAMGIDTIAVKRWEDTILVLEGVLGVTHSDR